MSIENESATSDVELESVLACEGDLPLREAANFEAEPTSPKTPDEQERESRLEAIAAGIESVLGTAIMRVAALVAEAHEIHRYQHGDGGFEGWVERRLKMSRRTAYNLLDVHKRFGHQSVQNFAHFASQCPLPYRSGQRSGGGLHRGHGADTERREAEPRAGQGDHHRTQAEVASVQQEAEATRPSAGIE
jgi:hypothetical protein